MEYTLETSLGYLVNRAARAMANRLSRNFAQDAYDITSEQWIVLVDLWSRDGQTQQELGEVTGKGKASITRLLHGLEKHNFVVRVPDRNDRRRNLIYLTRKGKDMRTDLIAVVLKTLDQAQEGIRFEDLDVCKTVLRRVTANLCPQT